MESNLRAVLEQIVANVGEHDPFRADLRLMLPELSVTQMHRCPLVKIGAFGQQQIGAA